MIAEGPASAIEAVEESLTGAYLSGRKSVAVPQKRRRGNGHYLRVKGARENNLQSIDASIPLGTLSVVTGVSGSGKSSLVIEIIYKRLAQLINGTRVRPGEHDSIRGYDALDKVIDIDQSPIGRTPRSNPATYTNLFTPIRQLFASLPDAKLRGFGPGRFSFNVKGGRCEACKGDGILRIEMQFLPDIYVPCDVCDGARYNRETLEIKYKGKSISDVLAYVDHRSSGLLQGHAGHPAPPLHAQRGRSGLSAPRTARPPTLSGGEAQRIKLSRELSRVATGRTLYILDEPTTGLHFGDVERLLGVLQELVRAGNTVLVIEHNLDIIKAADHLIDLGPEGGNRGGQVLISGTPEEVAACPESHTGHYLSKILV